MIGLLKSRREARQREAEEARKQQQVAELERIAAIPFPTATVPEALLDTSKQRSYDEVAQSLGFNPAELVRAQLLEFFRQEEFKLYDYFEVHRWLVGKSKQVSVSTRWHWRPLRQSDECEVNWHWNDEHGTYHRYRPECMSPYDRLVPHHALEKTIKIQEKFGDRVKFFVSDYAVPRTQVPDPFIMVRPAKHGPGLVQGYLFIFDVWDEPGFGL